MLISGGGKMQCIVCNKDAKYMFMGNSYCKEHKDKKIKQMQEAIDRAKK